MSAVMSASGSRFGSALRAAWRERASLAAPRRSDAERAFLPPALAIQETPVHPAPRVAAGLIALLAIGSVAWSWFGQIDVVAVAHGRIVVQEHTKTVQPLDSGIVRRLLVREGEHVEAGQVLVELDATTVEAEGRSIEQQWRAARSERLRSEALLAALAQPSRGLQVPAELEPEAVAQLRSEWADLGAREARQQAEAVRRGAELATAREAAARVEATLPLAREREADYEALRAQGFVSRHAGQDRSRERLELEREFATQQARIREGEAALHATRQEARAAAAEAERRLHERLAEARLRLRQLEEEGARARQRERQHVLRAPVAGTVQQLAVHTTGGVVTPAQPLMVIVPDEAALTAEVRIEPGDIGFVRQGQPAVLKLETFPFTRYGTVPAELRWIARDAVLDEKQQPGFPARLVLGQRAIRTEHGETAIGPGMAVTAELKLGRRRVIDYLLSPLQQRVDESLRER